MYAETFTSADAAATFITRYADTVVSITIFDGKLLVVYT